MQYDDDFRCMVLNVMTWQDRHGFETMTSWLVNVWWSLSIALVCTRGSSILREALYYLFITICTFVHRRT